MVEFLTEFPSRNHGSVIHSFCLWNFEKEPTESPLFIKCKIHTEATCFEKFPLVIASKYNIPFAINKPGSGFRIKGELFTVDEETLAKLDELENHPTLYVRQLQSFETTDGKIVEAWVYLLQEYKPEMLELEFFESYFSEGKHGKQYVASDDDLTKPEDILQVLRIK